MSRPPRGGRCDSYPHPHAAGVLDPLRQPRNPPFPTLSTRTHARTQPSCSYRGPAQFLAPTPLVSANMSPRWWRGTGQLVLCCPGPSFQSPWVEPREAEPYPLSHQREMRAWMCAWSFRHCRATGSPPPSPGHLPPSSQDWALEAGSFSSPPMLPSAPSPPLRPSSQRLSHPLLWGWGR